MRELSIIRKKKVSYILQEWQECLDMMMIGRQTNVFMLLTKFAAAF